MAAQKVLTKNEAGNLHDQEDHMCSEAGQKIDDQEVLIPDADDVAERNDFELDSDCYDIEGQHLFQGLPHKDPRNHVEELEDLVSNTS